MSGLSGGNYGQPGQVDTEYQFPLDGSNIHATINANATYELGVPDNYKLRTGGDAGEIAKSVRTSSTTQVITTGDGAYNTINL